MRPKGVDVNTRRETIEMGKVAETSEAEALQDSINGLVEEANRLRLDQLELIRSVQALLEVSRGNVLWENVAGVQQAAMALLDRLGVDRG